MNKGRGRQKKPTAKNVAMQLDLHYQQGKVLTANAHEILYGGAAGGGKSHLCRVLAILYCCKIPRFTCVIFRRERKDLYNTHWIGQNSWYSMLEPLLQAGAVQINMDEIRFWNGSTILGAHCQYEKDMYSWQGPEVHLLIMEEATQFTPDMISFFNGRCRFPDNLAIPNFFRDKLPQKVYPTNPLGVGSSYFKRMFGVGKEGTLKPEVIYKYKMGDAEIRRIYIPAKVRDNPSINPDQYIQQLSLLGRKEWVEALLDGSWDIAVGQYFSELNRQHVIPSIIVPKHWYKYRAFDWGSSAPFAVLWACVSDGSEITTKRGGTVTVPRGAIIIYREWLGAKQDDTTKGLSMTNEQIALGIIEKTKEEVQQPILTDSLPFADRGGRSIADDFSAHGIRLVRADNERIPGWIQVKNRLKGVDGFPMLYFTEDCPDTYRTLQMMQTELTDVEDVADHPEDHLPDVVRYLCNARPLIKDAPRKLELDVKIPTFDQMLKDYKKAKLLRIENELY